MANIPRLRQLANALDALPPSDFDWEAVRTRRCDPPYPCCIAGLATLLFPEIPVDGCGLDNFMMRAFDLDELQAGALVYGYAGGGLSELTEADFSGKNPKLAADRVRDLIVLLNQ